MADRKALRRCIVVRHAESEANAGLQTSAPATIALSAHGYKQARQLARLWEQAPELMVLSPYRRTQQSASPTRQRFPATPCVEWPVQEFTYLDPVRCHATTAAQREPLVAAYWLQADPLHVDGPDCESFAAFTQRATQFLAAIHAAPAHTLLVWTHGQFINMVRWLLAHPGHDPAHDMAAWRAWSLAHPIPNAARLELRLRARGWQAQKPIPLPEL